MDFISASKLKVYESILDEIHRENERNAVLVDRLNQKNLENIAFKLASKPENFRRQLSYVNVKIFDNLLDLYDAYDANDINFMDLSRTNTKFCLIELFIVDTLKEKLNENLWLLNVAVIFQSTIKNRTIPLKLDRIPILMAVPYDESEIETRIKIHLLLPPKIRINLMDVCTNISYHFKTFTNRHSCDIIKDSLKIASFYNDVILKKISDRKMHRIEATLKNLSDNFNPISSTIQNCYHRLNLQSFYEHVDRGILLPLSAPDGDKIVIFYDQSDGVLKIKSSIDNMLHVKRYFLRHLVSDGHVGELTAQMKDLDQQMKSCTDLNDVKFFVDKLRKFCLNFKGQ